ncbi:hypothetical protein MUA02_01125 [Enterobacteriaceae bacterium H20N1]|uniref:Uncharacterized protein n=1 Tax=Dryocola boscaweniae TaxID=2925397 RepID=A0A9X2W449_9ENTR|nr:hypothetical protein [Dryocola boscaweniae]MCT4700509.1 hypothetical protein [Dryocola boscaweniae]MCT4717665.1 hypothetical protein [Dryocola boscaweniae]
MTTPEEFQLFIQQMQRDTARLDRQACAFEALKKTLEELKEAAPHDPEAARRLEQVNALHQDANFQTLYAQAERDLRMLNGWLARANRQAAQAERTATVPQSAEKVGPGKQKSGRRKKHNFV